MASAPVVQTLAQVMADLNPAYAGQESVIQKQQAGLGAKYDAQRSALTAAKGQGFNDINNQATGRGASFSGVPIDEQATYLATKYLPGLQQADSNQNEEGLALEGNLAKLGTEKTNAALGRIDQQTSDLNEWNRQQAEIEANAAAAEKDRQFQASQSALARAASAAESARNRAASAPKTVSPDQAALSIIGGATGKDGFVSPSTFQLARDYYVQAGGKASDFASKYWKYTGANSGQKNAAQWKSYYYG